tara:strand:+ start:1012 stop:2154 length:1143 start_codon:yes stop_codon:yes gene_type:complete
MATSFKTFIQGDDVGSTRNLLHEAIPITGTIVSGTYTEGGTLRLGYETNIKNYSHGMFESVYDYPYLSSSANHIFDLSIGVSTNSGRLTASSAMTGAKGDMYNELCQMLAGYDTNGHIQELDVNGNFTTGSVYVDGSTMREVFIINFARLLSKDEIQPASGSFVSKFSVESASLGSTTMTKKVIVFDKDGTSGVKTNSPAGEFNTLYATSSFGGGALISTAPQPAGLIFYQAGIAVITSSIFQESFNGASGVAGANATMTRPPANRAVKAMFSQTNISGACNALRNRMFDVDFNNTTELNSTIYFCRANRTEFNFSSNPTYLTSSKIRVRDENVENPPISYITTVGLYGQDNELLAVGKLSEPLKKTPSDEFTLRVRLDY